jgi:hypothetical protein
MDRHDRQARLEGVGPAGQRRIAAAEVSVCLEGLAAEVATRYLAGAGVGRLRVADAGLGVLARSVDPGVQVTVDPSLQTGPAAGDLRDPVASELARGAREALRALAAILEGAS